MSEKKLPDGVYADAPNIVHIKFQDNSGEAERFVAGKTLDEVLESLGMSMHVDGPAKARRKRRTKAEMTTDAVLDEAAAEVPPPHRNKDKAWA